METKRRVTKICKEYEHLYPEHLHGYAIQFSDPCIARYIVIPRQTGVTTARGTYISAPASVEYVQIDMRHTEWGRMCFTPLGRAILGITENGSKD